MTSLEKFETLLKEMEHAALQSDTNKICALTSAQQVCLGEMVEHAKQNAFFKSHLKSALPRIQAQLERNNGILQQGLSITETMIRLFYDNTQGSVSQRDREYSTQAYSI